VRQPPPTSGAPSTTVTDRPDPASVMAAASPLGPDPTTTASIAVTGGCTHEGWSSRTPVLPVHGRPADRWKSARSGLSLAGVRIESAVTSLSWIPSEAVRGGTRVAFDAGFTHYDEPPPDEIEDIEVLRTTDRFRFANVLGAWAEFDGSGAVVDSGYSGGGLMGSTTVALAGLRREFEAVALPDIQAPSRWVTGGPGSPRRRGEGPDCPHRAGSAAAPSSSGRPRWCGPR